MNTIVPSLRPIESIRKASAFAEALFCVRIP